MVAEYVKYTKSQYRHEVYRKFIDYKITIIFKAILSRTYGRGSICLRIRYSGRQIYLLTAIGLTLGGSSTVHIYTQTTRRTT